MHTHTHARVHTHVSLLPSTNSPRAFDFSLSFYIKQNFNPTKKEKKMEPSGLGARFFANSVTYRCRTEKMRYPTPCPHTLNQWDTFLGNPKMQIILYYPFLSMVERQLFPQAVTRVRFYLETSIFLPGTIQHWQGEAGRGVNTGNVRDFSGQCLRNLFRLLYFCSLRADQR